MLCGPWPPGKRGTPRRQPPTGDAGAEYQEQTERVAQVEVEDQVHLAAQADALEVWKQIELHAPAVNAPKSLQIAV